MTHHFKAAWRSLVKAPGFTLAALTILALGIGANAVVFGVVDSILLKPLPFGDRAARLVTLHSTHPTQAPDWDDSLISYADLLDLGEASRSLEGIEALFARNFSLAGTDESERVLGASVTPGLFPLLGVHPQAGRVFTDEEAEEPGFETTVILSDALWHRRFGGDPTLVGKTVLLNARAVTVVGIMPPGFRFPENHDLWLPYAGLRDTDRARRTLLAIGLLREDVRLDAARAELEGLAATLAARYPTTNRGWGVHLMPLREFFVNPSTRRGLAAMLGAVLLVLLIGCANIAGLLLARGAGRQRELALRAAMGAGRGQLVSLLLIESLILGIAGGLLGLLAAAWGFDAVMGAIAEPPPYWVQLGLDARVVAFVLVLSVATAVASGLLPALRITRSDLARNIGAGSRAGAAPGPSRIQGVLIAGQIAVSLALLVAATLLMGTVRHLQLADAGFDPRPLLSFRVYLAGDAYDDPAARARTISRMLERMGTTPGVVTAAATTSIPADDGGETVRGVPERGVQSAGEEIGLQMMGISPELWDTLGLSLPSGRTFTAAEAGDPDARVALVNQRLAKAFWPGEDPLGRHVGIVRPEGTMWLRVVGIAPNLVYEEFGEETEQSRLNVYVPSAVTGGRTMAFLVRTRTDPAAAAVGVRKALREIDAGLAAHDVLTMRQRLAVTQWGQRFLGTMFAGFAVAAVLLACLGVYAMMAYAAGQRLREVGVRLALGARPVQIVGLLLGRAVRLTAVGLAVGLPVALGGARLVEGLLYGVSAWSLAVWLTLPLLLSSVVVLASYLPARRASRTDPAVVLRAE